MVARGLTGPSACSRRCRERTSPAGSSRSPHRSQRPQRQGRRGEGAQGGGRAPALWTHGVKERGGGMERWERAKCSKGGGERAELIRVWREVRMDLDAVDEKEEDGSDVTRKREREREGGRRGGQKREERRGIRLSSSPSSLSSLFSLLPLYRSLFVLSHALCVLTPCVFLSTRVLRQHLAPSKRRDHHKGAEQRRSWRSVFVCVRVCACV